MLKKQSNHSYRRGIRSYQKWMFDMVGGSDRENDIMLEFFVNHNEKYNDVFFIKSFYRINKNTNIKKRYFDSLDFSLDIEKDNTPCESIVEVEHLNKSLLPKYQIVGKITRINTYGMSSRCINNYEMRNFCYCFSYHKKFKQNNVIIKNTKKSYKP
jgi:hypothetical protein